MLNYKGAIFDMDGTILDSMKLWSDIDAAFLSKRGIEVPEDYIVSIAHMGAVETAHYTIERFGMRETPEALIEEWKHLALESYKRVREKSGTEEYFSYLKQNGVKIAIATATEPELAAAALSERNIGKMTDSVTTLSEVSRGKGFPDIYLRACEKLGLKPDECIVFEDLLMGIKGAKAGGFRTIAVYDECSAHDMDKIKETADGYIYSFKEMIRQH